MKGQQKAAETEEGTVQIQEVATGEDPTSVAIASIQSAATFPDPNIKYVFRTENGGTQVMYRVIQVAEGQLDGQTEGTGAISGYPAAQSMTQAVIQGAFTSEDAVETEATATETHYTYFPTTAVADTSTSTGAGTTATAVVTTQNSEALLGQATPTGTGQFFVMMSPQEVLQGGAQRSIAPRTHPYSPKSEAPRTTRDEKRRAQHNEVERRRRDKINNWIVQLSKIIPDCSMENTKSGQSKGGILSKACDYIQELRQSNHRLSEELQGLDQLQMDNEVLRQQVEDLKNKNLILRAQLRQHGVEIIIKNDTH
ncbi:upstream stimulatory factor 1 isoform X6 [Pelodiscus sinensis]|uniref:upstream stimulatory factor 1 isoform X6 n=1 Tax=Pelodiscus sinensis TaxID=13735 RepID=UPI0003C4D491|nr:upstream stimulatory factor 1 isoform X5 [Pelodiscus sinensis]|eukprot:XP_006115278.1 upstream stimulatory factor 1 isoform X5 [Pelodiscus sinensis]